MKPLPHSYSATASGAATNNLVSSIDNGCNIEVAPPKQFDGPGNVWSPEELLMASIANCLILSFRAIAGASQLDWQSIECTSEGRLEKVGTIVSFTQINTRATLSIASNEDLAKAERLLNRAEQTCFISNSLTAESHFSCEISTA